MATPIIVEYATDAASATKAVTAAVARLGYTLKHIDKENGIITFETGMSMKSWAGQSMSVHVMEVAEKVVQVTIGGKRNAHGAQMQVFDWGEASGIASKIVEALQPILGQGKTISGNTGSGGGCFVATAVYGSYEHPSVLVLRRFRDTKLATNALGRLFIAAYYRYSPMLVRAVSPYPFVKKCIRAVLERFVLRVR